MTLSKQEFVPLGELLKPGETTNTFHCKKGSGNDRLYITRTRSGDKLLAYCHHCGDKGVHTLERRLEHSLNDAKTLLCPNEKETNIVRNLPWPDDLDYNIDNWELLAKTWVFTSSVSAVEAAIHELAYSPSLKRIVIPILSDDGEAIGFQTRRIFDSDTRPKYITYKSESSNVFMNNKADMPRDPKTCILVEDKLSAIRCARFFDTIWMIGTNIGTNLTNYLTKNYESVIIFLDNDNQQVKDKQLRIHRLLSNLMKNKVTICETDKDPKKYHHTELLKKLTECLR